MISSTTSTDRTVRPEYIATPGQLATRQNGPRADQISTDNAEFLRSELSRQPEVRAEVVARAKALAADPAYPPMEALRKVAEQILASPDLTEDQS
jgi:hypothetical protein